MWMLALLFCVGCVYKAGGNLSAGILDEAAGRGKSGGVEAIARSLAEAKTLEELGRQFGDGVIGGVTEEAQQQRLEQAVDSLLAVAAARTGRGLREDVGPAFRQVARESIAQSLADGLREDVGPAAEDAVEKIVRRAALTAEDVLRDPALTVAFADMLRDSLYLALREGRPGTPGVGETLHRTLDVDVLDPVESSIGGLAGELAARVDESAQRTENVLKSVIGGLLVLLAGVGILAIVNQQRLARERETMRASHGQNMAVQDLLEMMPPEMRDQLMASLRDRASRSDEDLPS